MSTRRSEGLPGGSFTGQPVTEIANSWSELTPWPHPCEVAAMDVEGTVCSDPLDAPARRPRGYVEDRPQAAEGARFDFLVGHQAAGFLPRSR